MATPYCTIADVAAEWPLQTAFDATTEPTEGRVQEYMEWAALQLQTAMASSGLYDAEDFDAADNAEALLWLRDANIQGTLFRLSRWLHSYSLSRGSQQEPPFQDLWPQYMEQLRSGKVQWVDKGAEASGTLIPEFTQKFA